MFFKKNKRAIERHVEIQKHYQQGNKSIMKVVIEKSKTCISTTQMDNKKDYPI